MEKGVFVRFGFDELESRKFIDKSRAKQQRTPHEVYDVQPSLTSITLVVVVRVSLYTYTGVGLSALLVSTCRAMREPQFVERVTEVAPRFFICRLTFCEIRQYGSRWQKTICNMAISSIEHRGSWYEVFDARGKKAKTIPDHIGELLGWSDKFFIVVKGSWYDTYDEQGHRIKTIPSHIGNFVSICADQFMVHLENEVILNETESNNFKMI